MVPIYRSDGEWIAVYHDGHLFNVDRDWIGFVVGENVFDTAGSYLGFLNDDMRLLRRYSIQDAPPRRVPPARPEAPEMPAGMRLPPIFKPIPSFLVDVFEEFPERFTGIADTRDDME